MAEDLEIETLQVVAKALEPLDQQARMRVVNWAAQRYGIGVAAGLSGETEKLGKTTDSRESRVRRRILHKPPSSKDNDRPKVSTTEITNLIRSAQDAEAIESHILDQHSQVNRVLLPLYVVHRDMDDRFALSALEIADVCKQLSVPIAQENVSKMLRGAAARFVMQEGDGNPKRFKLIRRGAQHIAATLSGVHEGNTVDLDNAKASPDAA
jgi:hypothetical protein